MANLGFPRRGFCQKLYENERNWTVKGRLGSANAIVVVAAFMGRITGPYGPSDWRTAKAHCESLGQKILTIDSPEEEDDVTSVLNPTES